MTCIVSPRISISSRSAAIAILMLLPLAAEGLSAEWVQLHPTQRVSPKRSGHAAFVHNKTPYVFGGYVEEESGGDDASPLKRYVVNDLWRYRDETWSLLEPTTATAGNDNVPGPRLVSATAVCANKAYIFGGWDPETEGTGGVILDTVHELDLESLVYTKLNARMPGGPTSRHVAVALEHDNTIVIHNHRCNDHVLVFTPATGEFTKQPTAGVPCCPSSRGLHAATRVDDTTICIFGGAAQDQGMSNEAFLLDTATWEWTQVGSSSSSTGPSPRAGPCLVTLNNKCVLLYGGAEATDTGLNPRGDVWALNLETNEWTLLLDDDNDNGKRDALIPPPRNAATLTEIELDDDGTSKKSFLLTGGWAPFRETWDDSYVLRVSI